MARISIRLNLDGALSSFAPAVLELLPASKPANEVPAQVTKAPDIVLMWPDSHATAARPNREKPTKTTQVRAYSPIQAANLANHSRFASSKVRPTRPDSKIIARRGPINTSGGSITSVSCHQYLGQWDQSPAIQ